MALLIGRSSIWNLYLNNWYTNVTNQFNAYVTIWVFMIFIFKICDLHDSLYLCRGMLQRCGIIGKCWTVRYHQSILIWNSTAVLISEIRKITSFCTYIVSLYSLPCRPILNFLFASQLVCSKWMTSNYIIQFS